MTRHPHSPPPSTEFTPRSQAPSTEPHPLEGLMDPRATAAYLGLSVLSLADWRVKGTGITYIKVGRSVRYRMSDVQKWISANTVTTGD